MCNQFSSTVAFITHGRAKSEMQAVAIGENGVVELKENT